MYSANSDVRRRSLQTDEVCQNADEVAEALSERVPCIQGPIHEVVDERLLQVQHHGRRDHELHRRGQGDDLLVQEQSVRVIVDPGEQVFN